MLLGILTMVVLPMLMVMDRQNDFLVTTNQQAQSQFYAKKLMDAVDPHMPRVVDVYDVPISVGGLFGSSYQTGTRYSVWCDPAAKDINKTVDFAAGTGRCLLAGTDYIKGPFFERDVSIDSTNNTVQIRVSLYTAQSGGTAFFQASRDVDIDVIRVNLGLDVNDTPSLGTVGTHEDLYYAPNVATDNYGQIWTPEYFVTSPGALTGIYDTTTVGASCSFALVPYTSTTTANLAAATSFNRTPFNRTRTISGCNTGEYAVFRFRVLPLMTYDLNLYYVASTGVSSCSNSGSASNIRCDSSEVVVTTGAVTPVKWQHVDAYAEAAEKNGMGYMRRATVSIPSGVTQLSVSIRQSDLMGGAGRETNPVGIELIKRWDKND